ncbi:hypothetical protein [Streptomyces flaveolus]|uniref:hypothetical protein n=1 Tax=Streptomyces flaveolus TaxID=67297 RepID=UPI0036FB94A7
MNGWQRDGAESESEPESRAGAQAEPETGSGHGPSEERGRAAWTPDGGDGADGPVEPPAWASAQTRTSLTPPPPLPSQWTPAPAPPPAAPGAGGATPAAPAATAPTPAGPAPAAPWAPDSAGSAPAAPWAPGPAGPPSTAPGATPAPSTYGPQPAPTAPPYQPPPPGPGPGSGPGLRRVLVALTATAVLGAGVGAGVWALTRDDGTDRAGDSPATGVTVTDAPTAPASGTAPASAAPVTSAATSSSATTASASPSAALGYRRAQDPVGYAITVPEGWRRHERQGESAAVVTYDSPDGGRQLQIFALVEETPAASLDLAENATGYGFARQPGYRALTRSSGGDAFSELVYRYDDEDRGPRQVIDHRFRAADGTLYAIRSSGPETLDGALLREPLTRAVDSFCPADGECA